MTTSSCAMRKAEIDGQSPRADLPFMNELLLLLAQASFSDAGRDRFRKPRLRDIDWTALGLIAQQHGLNALAYRGLVSLGPGLAPSSLRASLREAYLPLVARNISFTRQLLQIVQLLEEHDIEVLPIKGPVLAAMAYGDITLRQFGDLDILIREQDVGSVERLLGENGFYRESYLGSGRNEQIPAFRCNYFTHFIRQNPMVVVDCHWQIEPRYLSVSRLVDLMWKNRQTFLLEGQPVRTASPETTLVYLCVHAARHCFEASVQILDVAQLIRSHPAMDWGQVMDESSSAVSAVLPGTMLWLVMLLSCEDLPDEVRSWIESDTASRQRAERVVGNLFVEHTLDRFSHDGSSSSCARSTGSRQDALCPRLRVQPHPCRMVVSAVACPAPPSLLSSPALEARREVWIQPAPANLRHLIPPPSVSPFFPHPLPSGICFASFSMDFYRLPPHT